MAAALCIRLRQEAGMATAEFALAMPAIALCLGAIIGAGQAVVAKISCIDAARAGARAAARGDDSGTVRRLAQAAVDGPATVGIATGDISRERTVKVQVRQDVQVLRPIGPRLQLSCQAQAASEGSDRGSVSIMFIGLIVLALAALGLVAGLGGAVAMRHRSEAAADLAALAGANTLLGQSSGHPCQEAERIAAANGGKLTDCRVESSAIEVKVEMSRIGWTAPLGPAVARARAGAGPERIPPEDLAGAGL